MLKTNKYCSVRFDYLSPFFPFLLDGCSLFESFCQISIMSHAVYVGAPSGADFVCW